MDRFHPHILWCQRRISDAREALSDLKRGDKIRINDEDVTQEWITTYEHIIEKCQRLIAAYEAHR